MKTSGRTLRKEWKDKRSGFTRRVRWYESGSSIRLKFLDLRSEERSVFYTDRYAAMEDWKAFIDGATPSEIHNGRTAR